MIPGSRFGGKRGGRRKGGERDGDNCLEITTPSVNSRWGGKELSGRGGRGGKRSEGGELTHLLGPRGEDNRTCRMVKGEQKPIFTGLYIYHCSGPVFIPGFSYFLTPPIFYETP